MDPVYIKRGGARLRTGTYDWMLRLYQHHGATRESVRGEIEGEPHLLYDLQEWDWLIDHDFCWLEYLQPSLATPLRTAGRTARLCAIPTTTKHGPQMAVPLYVYSKD